jgi:hypothetical protein
MIRKTDEKQDDKKDDQASADKKTETSDGVFQTTTTDTEKKAVGVFVSSRKMTLPASGLIG